MKKKSIFAMLFCLIISVCVLFTGCGETDLSEVNKQIANLQNQITTLQTELQNAKGDISSLQSQLAIASANYDRLNNKINGVENSYYKLNDTFTYSTSGIKLFDLTLTEATYNSETTNHRLNYTFNSYVSGLDNLYNENINISILFYNQNTNKTYSSDIRENTNIIVFSSIPNEINDGLVYIYIGNTIAVIYQINFVSL